MEIEVRHGYRKEKAAVLLSWFLLLIGMRLLIAQVLSSSIWVGSLGSVTITFAIFCLALRYTPLQRYRHQVNLVLLSWYRKRYFLAGVLSSTLVISGLIFLIEFGYSYHGSILGDIASTSVLWSLTHQQNLDQSAIKVQLAGYSIIDRTAILAAIIDKSTNGYYLKTASYLFAENIEVMAFLFVIRRVGANFF